ncbi:S1 family peptidase [Streptomyces lateritius]|uniref:S1 family peptidase n=1 Tax=Streptomyces TaxID=1883 RepID=UPI00093B11E2
MCRSTARAHQGRAGPRAAERLPAGVSAWSVDLAADTVTVETSGRADAAGKAFLKAATSYGKAVRVVRNDPTLVPRATVVPGNRMTFNGYLPTGTTSPSRPPRARTASGWRRVLRASPTRRS